MNYEEKALAEFDEIEREWEKHETMSTCSVCDSPKGHTRRRDFFADSIDQAVQNGRKQVLKEIILEQKHSELEGKGYDFYFSIRHKLHDILWKIK